MASLCFASSGHIFSPPFAKWFALMMFLVLDVVVNIVQTPVRAIVSDMASPYRRYRCSDQLFGCRCVHMLYTIV